MRLRLDKQADALYMTLSDRPVHDSEELRPGLIVDFSEGGEIIGFEFLRASELLASADLESFDFERE